MFGEQAAAELIRAGEIGRETARVFHVAPLEFAGGHFFREDDARFAVGVAPGDDDLHADVAGREFAGVEHERGVDHAAVRDFAACQAGHNSVLYRNRLPSLHDVRFPRGKLFGDRKFVFGEDCGAVVQPAVKGVVVIFHHARRGEPHADLGDAVLHPPHPLFRHAALRPVVIRGDDFVLEHAVDEFRVEFVLVGVVLVRLFRGKRPAGSLLHGFRPPAVRDAEIERAVERGFHAARAARLLHAHRRVHPQVRPLHEQPRHVHVVILEKYDARGEFRPFERLDGFFQYLLSLGIVRMRLAGDDDDDGARGVVHDGGEFHHVGEQHARALVFDEPPRKPDDERVLLKVLQRLEYHLGMLHAAFHAAAQAGAQICEQAVFNRGFRLPNFFLRHFVQPFDAVFHHGERRRCSGSLGAAEQFVVERHELRGGPRWRCTPLVTWRMFNSSAL